MADKKDEPTDPIIGREWGNYVVDAKIGEGGMGSVYRLVHKTLPNTFAALKVLSPEGAALATARERFEQEARAAALIGKERVAAVRDYGTFPEDGRPYIVMDLVEGQSLAALLRETGPLRVIDALLIARNAAETLVTAHGKQIIHRDIKPSNLMISRTRAENYSVTILDWGIAKARGEQQVAHTGTAVVAGTLGYMAPETMVPNATIDGRVDVFSLGVTLFEMLAGHKPYMLIASADQIPDAIDFYRQHPVSIGRTRPPALDPVPRWLERTVLRALILDQTDRLTMDKFWESLDEAIARLQKDPESLPPSSRGEETDAQSSSATESSTPEQTSLDQADKDPKTQLLSSPSSERGTRKLVETPTTARMPRARRTAAPIVLVGLGVLAIGLMLLLSGRPQTVQQVHSDIGFRKESLPLRLDLGTPLVSDSVATPPIEVQAGPKKVQRELSAQSQLQREATTRGSSDAVRPPPKKPPAKKCKSNAAGALICP